MIANEIEREGIPVGFITSMVTLATNTGTNRIIAGVNIPHPCGDPDLSPEADRALRQEIVKTALDALQRDVDGPTVFEPKGVSVS